ncbi:MAG TPA: hypothetical protein VIK91_21160 [Nannocystis sp.]
MRPVLFAMAFAACACRLPNEDHCVHKADDSDAWCAAYDPKLPYCSPCVADQHGCVAEQPDPAECPAYEPDTTGDTTS